MTGVDRGWSNVKVCVDVWRERWTEGVIRARIERAGNSLRGEEGARG